MSNAETHVKSTSQALLLHHSVNVLLGGLDQIAQLQLQAILPQFPAELLPSVGVAHFRVEVLTMAFVISIQISVCVTLRTGQDHNVKLVRRKRS
jgi:hypothetical protein